MPSWTTEVTERPKIELLLDFKAKSFRIWANDTKCDSFLTQFAMPGSIPTRALVSYPGSGNTWIRLVKGDQICLQQINLNFWGW